MKRHSLEALVINLGAATAMRLLVPYTLVDSGERFRYVTMSRVFPIPNCPGFHCFRILPPLIAGLWPFDAVDAFLVTGWLFEALAGTMLWLIAEHLHGSRRIAFFTIAFFWTTWGSIQSLNDPLLIVDPVQAFWSFASLYLLLTRRYALALPLLVSGAAVKESVLLIPMIYVAYAVLANDEARRRPVWLAVLVAVPLAAWLLLRSELSARFGYVNYDDESYVRATYFFGFWLPNLAPWPKNLLIAALYVFAACGAAWMLAVPGFLASNRRQQALTLASLPPMLFMALYQVPDRALAIFPYATLIPAARFTSAVPLPIAVALLLLNAAFSIRMNAAVWWLPRMPIILAALVAVTAVALWTGWFGGRRGETVEEVRSGEGDGIARLIAVAVVVLIAAVVGVQIARAASTYAVKTESWPAASLNPAHLVDDDTGALGVALSADGRWLAFVGRSEDAAQAQPTLWRRHVDDGRVDALPGTAGASAPFWSPDGRAIGFFAGRSLKTIDLASGTIRVLADAPFGHGGTWSPRGVIVFAPDITGGLEQISANGGAVTPATVSDRAAGEEWHRWPSFLPDGDRFLVAVGAANRSDAGLYLARLSSRQRILVAPQLQTRAVQAHGVVVFGQSAGLFAQVFDDRREAVFGNWRRLAAIDYAAGASTGAFAMSNDRLVVVSPRPPAASNANAHLILVTRSGERAIAGSAASLTSPEVPSDMAARLPRGAMATSWSPDRRVLLFHAPAPPRWDVWAMPTAPDAAPVRAIANDGFSHVQAQFSPDGRWIAYVRRDDLGSEEVYVQPYPPNGSAWRVSWDGGAQPRWRGDGTELVYVSANRFLRSVRIDSTSAFHADPPRPLFEVPLPSRDPAAFRFEYTMSADGREFLANAIDDPPAPTSVSVIRNWAAAVFR